MSRLIQNWSRRRKVEEGHLGRRSLEEFELNDIPPDD